MARERPSSSKMRATRTSKEDILMSIKPEHMSNIAAGRKNHEYRGYLLPSSVRRLWLYTTAPISRIEYVARISRGKTRGEVAEDGGIGNADFNAGRKVSKYAYEILELWKLREPISLASAISSGFLKGPPQKYCWAPVALLAKKSKKPLLKGEIDLDRTCLAIRRVQLGEVKYLISSRLWVRIVSREAGDLGSVGLYLEH
ncbi:hypothetical protein IFM46972_06685 [Aspergillus udagawae]|uniref:Uncharacterized protein n=1 Tax=Aspergillus udagawae TaxID=91492 RepID=A0A8H3RVV1_9EURO|nr:hypothetical protein IFM46972_06685 [Aspergillus udagawae]